MLHKGPDTIVAYLPLTSQNHTTSCILTCELPFLYSVKKPLQLPGPLAVHKPLSDASVQAPGELRGQRGQDPARDRTLQAAVTLPEP